MSQISISFPKTRFELTFGGIHGIQLVASMISASFYGISMSMAVQYFKYHSKGDSPTVKGMVILLVCLATIQVASTSHQMFDYFIFKFGHENLFDPITFAASAKYLGIYLTAFVAQLFYATRIWTVGSHLRKKYRLLAYPVLLFALLQVSSGMAQVYLMGYAKTFGKLGELYVIAFNAIIVQGISASACDVAITLSFTFIFHKHRSGINSRMNSLMNQLIIYGINRAAATSLCALLTIFMFHYLSGTYAYMIPLFVNTHIYVISVLSVLTARGTLQDEEYSLHLTDLARVA